MSDFRYLLFIMKVEYTIKGYNKIPSDVTDLTVILPRYHEEFEVEYIIKYKNIIKFIVTENSGFWLDKYLPYKYVIIDNQFDYEDYIFDCRQPYTILTSKAGIPILFNNLSMISPENYRNLSVSMKNMRKYQKALELYDRVIQFPEFLPKFDQFRGIAGSFSGNKGQGCLTVGRASLTVGRASLTVGRASLTVGRASLTDDFYLLLFIMKIEHRTLTFVKFHQILQI